MRIFKKELKKELTNGMSIGECIITKCNTEYGEFIIHQKDKEGSFPFIGVFKLLEYAVNCVESIEKPFQNKWEYYLQSQSEQEEGLGTGGLEVMGSLGWELCGVDTNVTDSEGKAMYIYKRKLPLQPRILNEDIPINQSTKS